MIDIDRARELDDDRHINYEPTFSADEYYALEDKIEDLQCQIADLEIERDEYLVEVLELKLKILNEELYDYLVDDEIKYCKECDSFCLSTEYGMPEQGCWNCNYDDYHENQLDLTNEEIKLLKEIFEI